MVVKNFRATATMAALVIGCTFILPDGMDNSAYAKSHAISLSPAASQTAMIEEGSVSVFGAEQAIQSSFTVTPVTVDGKITFVSRIN